MKRKGQFFIVGAVVLCMAFFAGLPPSEPLIRASSEDITHFSENIQRELSKTMNFGLDANNTVEYMENFTEFADRAMAEHLINYTSLWLITGNSSSDLNVTAGNFIWLVEADITLNLSGIVKNLLVPYNTTNSTVFSSVPSEFNLTISYEDMEKTVEWQKDKANLYALVVLTKDRDISKNELTG